MLFLNSHEFNHIICAHCTFCFACEQWVTLLISTLQSFRKAAINWNIEMTDWCLLTSTIVTSSLFSEFFCFFHLRTEFEIRFEASRYFCLKFSPTTHPSGNLKSNSDFWSHLAAWIRFWLDKKSEKNIFEIKSRKCLICKRICCFIQFDSLVTIQSWTFNTKFDPKIYLTIQNLQLNKMNPK